MPRSRSRSIESRYWARMSRASTAPVISSIRSASVRLAVVDVGDDRQVAEPAEVGHGVEWLSGRGPAGAGAGAARGVTQGGQRSGGLRRAGAVPSPDLSRWCPDIGPEWSGDIGPELSWDIEPSIGPELSRDIGPGIVSCEVLV